MFPIWNLGRWDTPLNYQGYSIQAFKMSVSLGDGTETLANGVVWMQNKLIINVLHIFT